MTCQGQMVRWRLDMSRGLAMREGGTAGLSEYSVPLKPMLGCIALAPPVGAPAPDTGNIGPWGGNMDFNEIVEGATVFCPSMSQEVSCTSVMLTRHRGTES